MRYSKTTMTRNDFVCHELTALARKVNISVNYLEYEYDSGEETVIIHYNDGGADDRIGVTGIGLIEIAREVMNAL